MILWLGGLNKKWGMRDMIKVGNKVDLVNKDGCFRVVVFCYE